MNMPRRRRGEHRCGRLRPVWCGLCRTHLIERDEPLCVMRPVNVPVAIDPPARRIGCGRCQAAETAQAYARGPAA